MTFEQLLAETCAEASRIAQEPLKPFNEDYGHPEGYEELPDDPRPRSFTYQVPYVPFGGMCWSGPIEGVPEYQALEQGNPELAAKLKDWFYRLPDFRIADEPLVVYDAP
jgi:hypothetical protein